MRTLRFIHRWLGILLALPLIVQGLTGAIITLEPVWPSWHGGPLTPGEPASPGAILAGARRAAPPGMRPARYIAAGAHGEEARVLFVPNDAPRGPAMLVRLDPVSAQPLGPAEPATGVYNWVLQLHKALLIPQFGGRQVAGWFGAGLFVLIVLGIPLWWPRPGLVRQAFIVPRRARGLRLHRALHGAVGIWLSLMLLAVAVTGMAEGFPQTSRMLLGLAANPQGGRPPGGRPEGGPPPQPDLDAAWKLAQAAVPGTVLRGIILPASGRDPIRLNMVAPGEEGATAMRMVTVDAAATRVLSAPPRAEGADLVLRWAHDLHESDGTGPVWRGLSVLTGLALPLFSVTGVAMWWLKRRRRQRAAAPMAAAAE